MYVDGNARISDQHKPMHALLFCTLDSSAVGRRALVIWVSFMIYQAIFSFIGPLVHGFPLSRAVMLFLWIMFFCGAFGWLMKTLRDELRALGSLERVA